MTANYELYLLLPEEIDDQRYRSGLCGRETLAEPGATVNESIKVGEDDEAVERAIRISQQQQPPSLLTLKNFNSREEPNPKLEEKMKIWFSHK